MIRDSAARTYSVPQRSPAACDDRPPIDTEAQAARLIARSLAVGDTVYWPFSRALHEELLTQCRMQGGDSAIVLRGRGVVEYWGWQDGQPWRVQLVDLAVVVGGEP